MTKKLRKIKLVGYCLGGIKCFSWQCNFPDDTHLSHPTIWKYFRSKNLPEYEGKNYVKVAITIKEK
jgi:predicted sulfurtransferase